MTGLSMEHLPDEVLLEVFSYLERSDVVVCSEVCQRWQSITRSRRLWRNIQYRGKGDNSLEEAFEATKMARGFHGLSVELGRGTGITIYRGEIFVSLSPLAWEEFPPTLAEAVERLAPDLTELTVAGEGRLENHQWLLKGVVLAVPFHQLRSFRAEDPCGSAVDDTTMGTLCEHCPLLETLVLEGCHADRLTPAGGLAHLGRLPRLTTLRLHCHLSARTFAEDASCFNSRLLLPGCSARRACRVHDLSFLQHCQKLTSLHLSLCNEFVYPLPALRTLTLRCDYMEAVGARLDSTVRALPQLQELCLLGHWLVEDHHLHRIRAVAPISYMHRSKQSTPGWVCLRMRFQRH